MTHMGSVGVQVRRLLVQAVLFVEHSEAADSLVFAVWNVMEVRRTVHTLLS